MHKSVRRLGVMAAATGAALALGMGPAAADTDDAITPAPTGAAECGQLSEATLMGWENWDTGGWLVGEGAARMVSGAWIGAPSSLIDLASGAGLSEATILAWQNWDEGGGMLGEGAAMMVSGAWVGAPNSIVDLAGHILCVAGGGAAIDGLPVPELPVPDLP